MTSTVALPTPPAPRPRQEAPAFRLLYNSDGNHIFQGEARPQDPGLPWHERSMPPRGPMTVAELERFVDEVAASQVDTFLLCPINNQVVTYKSALERRLGDGATPEQLAASNTSMQNVVGALRGFDAQGVDPFQVLVQRIREKKMRPFVTYRVQQAHSIAGTEKRPGLSPFWEQNPQYRIQGNSGGDSESALNFAVAEVRARKVALLRELVSRYDFDGCQLDFQRFPLFFPRGKETANIPQMNSFVRDVRAMLNEEGERKGRRLYLGVRVPETLERCRKLGLDPVTWVNEGLLDCVVVTKFLAQNPTSAYAIPHLEEDFAAFRAAFQKPVKLLGCILAAYSFKEKTRGNVLQYHLDPQDYRDEAARYWARGVDGLEVFNFFLSRVKYDARGDRTEPPFFLLRELGAATTLGKGTAEEEVKWRREYPRQPMPEEYRTQLKR